MIGLITLPALAVLVERTDLFEVELEYIEQNLERERFENAHSEAKLLAAPIVQRTLERISAHLSKDRLVVDASVTVHIIRLPIVVSLLLRNAIENGLRDVLEPLYGWNTDFFGTNDGASCTWARGIPRVNVRWHSTARELKTVRLALSRAYISVHPCTRSARRRSRASPHTPREFSQSR